MSESDSKKDIVIIHTGSKSFQPLKKILSKDRLRELAGLDPDRREIFLVDNESKEHSIDSD